ncbi:MAG: hypothetical protein ABEJ36_01390 [Candidatus Nanosalina sp.]
MTVGAKPYFTLSRDFSPDEETVEIEVYRSDDGALGFYREIEGYADALESMDSGEFPPDDTHKLERTEERFEFSGEDADEYFRRLGNIASDFELSSPVSYASNTYRLEMFSQIGEHTEICRWSEDEVPGAVEDILDELEEEALS